MPFEDIADIDPKWEKWAERKLKDPSWRNEASMAYKRLVEATKNFNRAFEGKAEPREMEPHWISILQRIEAIELEIESQGFVRNYNIYTDQSDIENEPEMVDNSLNDQRAHSTPISEQVFSEDETIRPGNANEAVETVEPREEYQVVDDSVSDTSDGPGDGVLVASEISLGGINLDTSTSSFLTSSEDDMAISEDLKTSDSQSGMTHNIEGSYR